MSTSLVTPQEAENVKPAFTPHRKLGYLIYLTAAFGFGINGTVSKVLLQAVQDTKAVAQLRITAAMLVFVLIGVTTNRAGFRVKRHEWRIILAYGIGGVLATQVLFFISIQLIPVSIALLIEFIAPIFVVLWAKYVQHRSVSPLVWFGLTMAIAGLVLVGQVWKGLVFDGLGITVAFGAMLILVAYFLLGEHGGKFRDPMSFTMWGFVAAGLTFSLLSPPWLFPFAKFGGTTYIDQLNLDVPLWALALYMILGGTVFPFWATVSAMRHIGAAGASIMGMLEPLVASIVAWLVLSEALTLVQIFGGGIMLAGVIVAERARS